MTLPRPLRDMLATLVLDAFHDAGARRRLTALASSAPGRAAIAPPVAASLPVLYEPDGQIRQRWSEHARGVADRAERACAILDRLPLDDPDAPLPRALAQAALLFDAQLYFEVHELLEPHWMRAEGRRRASIQGLIQVAVGLEHLTSGNVAGARSLLREGIAKLIDDDGACLGLDVRSFASALRRCLDDLSPDASGGLDWSRVPRFPVAPT